MKLIDADKLLYDLANEDVPTHIHSWVLDAIKQGKYDQRMYLKLKSEIECGVKITSVLERLLLSQLMVGLLMWIGIVCSTQALYE